MNCAEGTLTENGSKWSKKRKRRSEVRKKLVVGREDQGRQINKEDGSWTTQQAEKSTNGCFGAPRGKEGKTGWQSPENVGQVDLGF
jgi:GH18 family chitinase